MQINIKKAINVTRFKWTTKETEQKNLTFPLNFECFLLCADNFGVHVLIQGKRETISSPWVTEDGQPLPYIGQFESVENNPNTLHIAVKPDGKWVKERSDWVFVFAVCEIET